MKEKNLQLYRNSNILSNKEEALNRINEISELNYINDGTPFVCRYNNGDTIETIFVITTKYNDKKQNSIFDTKDLKDLHKKIEELTSRIEKLENI